MKEEVEGVGPTWNQTGTQDSQGLPGRWGVDLPQMLCIEFMEGERQFLGIG